MYWEERQEKVEFFTYDSIDKIAEEIGLKVDFYPEVYWVGRKLRFGDLKLPQRYEGIFKRIKNQESSIFLKRPQMILIGKYFLDHIAEEAGHFLHFNNAKVKLNEINSIADFCIGSIVEMLGFFSSKLIKPSRRMPFKRYKDYLKDANEPEETIRTIKSFWEPITPYDVITEIYHNGYSMGENLFNHYVSGLVTRERES